MPWSLDRLTARLAEQEITISATHLVRLLEEARLSFQRLTGPPAFARSHLPADPRIRVQQHRLPRLASAQRGLADHVTHGNGRDHDRRIAALERRHRIAA